MTDKKIDLSSKINARAIVSDYQYEAREGQAFYYSPSKKKIHLAERLPNGDWYIYRTWRTKNVFMFV